MGAIASLSNPPGHAPQGPERTESGDPSRRSLPCPVRTIRRCGWTRYRNSPSFPRGLNFYVLLTRRSQLASMRRITKERRLLVAAARCGLKLIKARPATVTPYCLRALNDATFVVGTLPGDVLGLVKATRGREGVSWLSLRDVEKFLSTWTGSAPKERESPRKKRLRRVGAPHSLLRDMQATCRDGSSLTRHRRYRSRSAGDRTPGRLSNRDSALRRPSSAAVAHDRHRTMVGRL
jgi:hypothetical protein